MLQACNIQLMRYIEGQCLNSGRGSNCVLECLKTRLPVSVLEAISNLALPVDKLILIGRRWSCLSLRSTKT